MFAAAIAELQNDEDSISSLLKTLFQDAMLLHNTWNRYQKAATASPSTHGMKAMELNLRL
jgi:hypothetical protein